MDATLTFLGTGTSMGVPTLGCGCAVCMDARLPGSPNRRTRPSLRLSYNSHTVVVDTGPDFHAQALREDMDHVDAVLYTHGHADHILGFDDLRPLTFALREPMPVYADAPTEAILRRVFEYTFRTEDRYPTSARVALRTVSEEPGTRIELFGAAFERVPVTHGRNTITGFRFGDAAYLTDMSDIPADSQARLGGLDVLILDALRREPHPSHSHLARSLAFVEQLQPRRAFFTHISHDLDHDTVNRELPPHVRLAHDGLQLEFRIA